MAEEVDRTGMVQVELSEEDWKQRAEKLASEEAQRFALLDKKKTHNRKWNEELIQLRESIKQLTAEVDTRMAWVPAQADMDFGGGGGAANDEEPAEEKPTRRRRRRSNGAAAVDAAGADA